MKCLNYGAARFLQCSLLFKVLTWHCYCCQVSKGGVVVEDKGETGGVGVEAEEAEVVAQPLLMLQLTLKHKAGLHC